MSLLRAHICVPITPLCLKHIVKTFFPSAGPRLFQAITVPQELYHGQDVIFKVVVLV